MKKEWIEVFSKEQIEEGSILKIVGISAKNSYESISVKKIINTKRDTEVIINLKKNYYFNLDAYLDNRPLWGKWVKKVYVKS